MGGKICGMTKTQLFRSSVKKALSILEVLKLDRPLLNLRMVLLDDFFSIFFLLIPVSMISFNISSDGLLTLLCLSRDLHFRIELIYFRFQGLRSFAAINRPPEKNEDRTGDRR